jgi:hypothetical protein
MQVEITEAEAQSEFDTLLSMDSTGDGLIEFDNFCIWAARRQTDSRVKEEEQKDKESLGLSDVMHQYRSRDELKAAARAEAEARAAAEHHAKEALHSQAAAKAKERYLAKQKAQADKRAKMAAKAKEEAQERSKRHAEARIRVDARSRAKEEQIKRNYAEAQEALKRKKLEAKLDVIRNDPVAAARKKYATQLLRRLVPAAKALANDDGEPVFDARQQKVLQGIKRIVFNLRDENHLQVLEVVDELAHDLGVDDDDEIIPPNELPLEMFAEIGAEMVEILADDVAED